MLLDARTARVGKRGAECTHLAPWRFLRRAPPSSACTKWTARQSRGAPRARSRRCAATPQSRCAHALFAKHAKKAEVALVTGRAEVRSTALLPGIVPSSGRSRCSSVPRALPRAQRCACCCALVRQYWKRGVPAEGVKYSVSRPLLWPSARACARARLAGLQPPLVARGSEPLLHSRRRLTRVLPAHLADTRRAHALTKGCWSSPRCDSRVLVRDRRW